MSDNRTAEQFRISKNVHPNTDGSPWGWIVLENSPRVRVATWSGDEEYKYCQQLIEASQQTASLREENEKLHGMWSASERIRIFDAQSAIREANSLRGRIEQLQEEVERLRGLLKNVLPMAEDGYTLHKKNGSHQEFLSEDRELLQSIREALSSKESKPS